MMVAHVKLEGALALQGTTQMGLEGGDAHGGNPLWNEKESVSDRSGENERKTSEGGEEEEEGSDRSVQERTLGSRDPCKIWGR